MKIYLIAGETSGDQHAADLVRALKQRDPDVQIRGMAGDRCVAEGMALHRHYSEVSFMGFYEVVRHLGTIRKALRAIRKDITDFAPDRIVLVDYPGFNLRIARFAHDNGIPVHYYIAPKVWAWKESRVKKLKAYVNRLYCILPFEEAYFKQHGIEARYVGNPSRMQIKRFKAEQVTRPEVGKRIALLPGSRRQEISANLSIMLESMKHLEGYEPIISQAPGFDAAYYEQWAPGIPLESDMYQLLRDARGAIVTSGTATLETALHRVPQVVCYRTSWITYQLAKRFIRIPYISLVNIILNRPVLTELIQHEFEPKRIADTLVPLLSNPTALQADYDRLEELLGQSDPAENIAEELLRDIPTQ